MHGVSRAALALGSALMVCCSFDRAAAQTMESPPQLAYNYGENETPRSAAMAGALRALGSGTSAIFLNPANMAQSRIYHIEALGQFTPEVSRVLGGGVIVDFTRPVAGGISFIGGNIDPEGLDRSFIDVRSALAYPITQRILVGLGGRYLKVSQDGLGPLGDSKVSGGLNDPEGGRYAFVNALTLDIGLTFKATDSIFVGLIGQNLTHPGNGLLPTTVGGGIGYGTGDLSVEVDGLADFDSWGKATARVMAGGEYLVANHFPLRVGYRFDQGAEVHSLSGGVGYVGKEFSIEGAVRRDLSSSGGTTIVLGAALFLEATGLVRPVAATMD